MTDEEFYAKEAKEQHEAAYVQRLARDLVLSYARAGVHKAASDALSQAQQLWRATRSAYPDLYP